MICKNCGKEIPDNSKFCSYCGANQMNVEIEEKNTEEVEGTEELDKKQTDISTNIITKIKKYSLKIKKLLLS